MTVENHMTPHSYHCPRCQSLQVKEDGSNIFCPECDLTFNKKMIDLLEDEDILAHEELEGIVRVVEDDDDDLSLLL